MSKNKQKVILTRTQFESVIQYAYARYVGYESWKRYRRDYPMLTLPCKDGIRAIKAAWRKAKNYSKK